MKTLIFESEAVAVNAIKTGRLTGKQIGGLKFGEMTSKLHDDSAYPYGFTISVYEDPDNENSKVIARGIGKVGYLFSNGEHKWQVERLSYYFLRGENEKVTMRSTGSIHDWSDVGRRSRDTWDVSIKRLASFLQTYISHIYFTTIEAEENVNEAMNPITVNNTVISGGLNGKRLYGVEFSGCYNFDDDKAAYNFELLIKDKSGKPIGGSTGLLAYALKPTISGFEHEWTVPDQPIVFSLDDGDLTVRLSSDYINQAHFDGKLKGDDWMGLLKELILKVRSFTEKALGETDITESIKPGMSAGDVRDKIINGSLTGKVLNDVEFLDIDAIDDDRVWYNYELILKDENNKQYAGVTGCIGYSFRDGKHEVSIPTSILFYRIDSSGAITPERRAQFGYSSILSYDWFNHLDEITQFIRQKAEKFVDNYNHG